MVSLNFVNLVIAYSLKWALQPDPKLNPRSPCTDSTIPQAFAFVLLSTFFWLFFWLESFSHFFSLTWPRGRRNLFDLSSTVDKTSSSKIQIWRCYFCFPFSLKKFPLTFGESPLTESFRDWGFWTFPLPKQQWELMWRARGRSNVFDCCDTAPQLTAPPHHSSFTFFILLLKYYSFRL